MADSPLLNLPDMGALDGSERLYVVQDGADKNGTPQQIASVLLGLANTWARKQVITPAANESGLVVSGYSLTGANAQSLLDLSGTWNTSGTPTGLKFNVTDTASNTNSLLWDMQVGAVSKGQLRKDGQLAIVQARFGTIGGSFQPVMDSTITGLATIGRIDSGATRYVAFGNNGNQNGVFLQSQSGIYFNSTNTFGAIDASFIRDGAGILAQRSGVNAQTQRVYGTFTDASNNTWAGIDWQTTAGTPRLRAVAAGTGVAAPLAIDAYQKAGAAVAADIPAGTWALVRDTSGSTTKLIYNNAGTLMSVALT